MHSLFYSTLEFFLPRLIPGDPISVIVGRIWNVASETQELYQSYVHELD